MTITATTLSTAITSGVIQFGVASATGITTGNFQTGSGITVLLVDQEFMAVNSISGTVVNVSRGQYGSIATSHTSGALVQSGALSDFGSPIEILGSSLTTKETVAGLNLPSTFLSGAADVVSALVPGSYIVKTAGVDAMTLAVPTAAQEGNVIMVYSDTLFAHTITCPSAVIATGAATVKTVATFLAFRGSGLTLRAVNGVWAVMINNGPCTFA